ncbi:MAG: MoaD/ThiS family protein [Pseudomonadota bacterium]
MKMIDITIKLFANLVTYLPRSGETYPVRNGVSVGELIAELGIPADQAKLIFVNGRKQELDYILAQGDRVGIFPPVGGG